MWMETLFYLVFLGQVVLISYYFPRRVLTRINYVIKHCPAEKYAKLYPNGYDKALQKKFQYKLLNQVNLFVGLAIFTALVIASLQRETVLTELDFLPFAFGLVQAIPFLLLEVSALKQFKLMRQHLTSSKRHAELTPRSLFNYVSPARLFTTIFVFILCIYLMFSFNNFQLSKEIATLIGAMLLCNSLFFGLGYTLLNGKKLDPYQSPQDRKNMTIGAFESYTAVSILVSVFFMLNRSIEYYSLALWEPMINSLYWQAVVLLSTGTMLKAMPLDSINFDVYKANT